MEKRLCTLIGLICLIVCTASAQYTENDIYNYIEQYHGLAIEKMRTHGIPASITLAQGILESAAGTSELAVKANNHFGIKCHSTWSGPTYYKDDETSNECFRKYDKAEDSYRDHSEFLKARRYQSLFSIPPTDYKAWAEGLKECGYATNPKYPERLTGLIEKYRLSRYDTLALSGSSEPADTNRSAPAIVLDTLARPGMPVKVSYPYTKRTVYAHNGTYFVIAGKNESYLDSALDVQQPLFRIRKYNDLLSRSYEPKEGEWVYIEKKPKYSTDFRQYEVATSSESLRDICQRYGCQMRSIMTINQLERNTLLQKGQIILLQSNKNKK
ncbi:MAG: glucosaminidase domain-containing protein [Bacteroidales bacterium]|nr:glucosaminidase domain-containing protein [Bacteroidales bacterium]